MQNSQDIQSDSPELTVGLEETSTSEISEHHVTESSVETMPDLEQLLEKTKLDAAENYDAWLRAKADVDNMRKRAQVDISNAHKYAIENFSTELLMVMDSLEAALAVKDAAVADFKNGWN